MRWSASFPSSPSRRPPSRRRSPRSPAATSRRSSWRGRCCPSRRCSSPTSPPRASTSAPAPRSTASSARSPRRDVPVVVGSSDTKELEGLCDRVIVMSRGHAVATLEGDQVTEENIVQAEISATTHTSQRMTDRVRRRARILHFVEGDYAPGDRARHRHARARRSTFCSATAATYPTSTSRRSTFACAALGFISLGQTFALLLGGIDLSVGPLAGFLVVLGSFFVLDGKSPGIWALGFVLMFLAAVGVGLLNGSLIRFAKFTPVAATLVTYIGLGGLAFTLRPAPDGYIAASVTNAISTKVGPVPIAFIVFVLSAFALELMLRKSKFGLQLRAVGSSEESARRVGVPVNRVALLGYLGASLMTLLGAVVLLAQLGVGDPGQGTELHADLDHRGRPRRHEPARGARDVHRYAPGCRPQRSGAERHGLPQPRPEVAVHLPGLPDRRRSADLQPGSTRSETDPWTGIALIR